VALEEYIVIMFVIVTAVVTRHVGHSELSH
jgi:hypothetical protein